MDLVGKGGKSLEYINSDSAFRSVIHQRLLVDYNYNDGCSFTFTYARRFVQNVFGSIQILADATTNQSHQEAWVIQNCWIELVWSSVKKICASYSSTKVHMVISKYHIYYKYIRYLIKLNIVVFYYYLTHLSSEYIVQLSIIECYKLLFYSLTVICDMIWKLKSFDEIWT